MEGETSRRKIHKMKGKRIRKRNRKGGEENQI